MSDPEFIHQFRVSLRRINSLIKVFKPALPERFQQRWTKKLKALSQITGDVRDLEVMQNCILQPIQQSDNQQAQAQVSEVLVAHEEARQAALAQVKQLSFGGPVLLFALDVQELATDNFPKNLPRFAEKQVSGLHRNALKRLAKTLKSPTPENTHRFRIALKHLRYSYEFLRRYLTKKRWRSTPKPLPNCKMSLGLSMISTFRSPDCKSGLTKVLFRGRHVR